MVIVTVLIQNFRIIIFKRYILLLNVNYAICINDRFNEGWFINGKKARF